MDRYVKRGSTGVILHIPCNVGDLALGPAGWFEDAVGFDLIVRVIAIGDSGLTEYTTLSGNVETVSSVGTYEAPTSGKCRAVSVGQALELHLLDSWFAKTGNQLTIVLYSSGQGRSVFYTVGLTNIDVHNGEADVVKVAANTTAATKLKDAWSQSDFASNLTNLFTGNADSFLYLSELHLAATPFIIAGGSAQAGIPADLVSIAGFASKATDLSSCIDGTEIRADVTQWNDDASVVANIAGAFANGSYVDANATYWKGQPLDDLDVSGTPNVNVKTIGRDIQAGDNLRDALGGEGADARNYIKSDGGHLVASSTINQSIFSPDAMTATSITMASVPATWGVGTLLRSYNSSEIIRITAVNSLVLTVTRAYGGTQAGALSNTMTLYALVDTAEHKRTVDASVSSIAANAVTAAAINDSAITAAKLAADAITAAKIADGAIDAGAIASDAITAAKIADSAITDAKFATGTEPSGRPAVTAGIASILRFMLAVFGHKIETTSASQKVYKADGSTVMAESTLSDNGTTNTRGASS